MERLYAEAARLGLNAKAAGSSATALERGRAIARLLGYADAAEAGEGRTITHRYRIYMFQLDAPARYRFAANAVYAANGALPGTLYALGGSGRRLSGSGLWNRAQPDEPPDKRLRQAQKAAFRLLYLSGLDFGMADIGLGAGGRPALLGFDPYPAAPDATWPESFAGALERLRLAADLSASEAEEQPVLGADPEFLLTNANGQVVPASAYLPKRGRAGCDRVRIGGRALYPLAELRPGPSTDPRRLIVHIRRALLDAAELIPDTPGVKWLAGGMPARGFALGGHIHISRLELNMAVLKALDNYVALPLLLVEDERAKDRRPRYGIPGDYRLQPHGGFEYRTLPSWLVSPRVAKGAVALAAIAAGHYRELRERPLDRFDVLRRYMHGDKAGLRATVMPLLAQIRLLPDYAAYAALAEPLFSMIETGECWEESRDIRAGWKIGPALAETR